MSGYCEIIGYYIIIQSISHCVSEEKVVKVGVCGGGERGGGGGRVVLQKVTAVIILVYSSVLYSI